MATTQNSSPILPDQFPEGFAAVSADDGFRSEAERLYDCACRARDAESDWTRYCVKNHLI